jgi:hypothetical protein
MPDKEIKANEEETLAKFQDALLELLASGQSEHDIFETLKSDPKFDDYRDYISEFDPDMVAVACELMGKWAKRKDEEQNVR